MYHNITNPATRATLGRVWSLISGPFRAPVAPNIPSDPKSAQETLIQLVGPSRLLDRHSIVIGLGARSAPLIDTVSKSALQFMESRGAVRLPQWRAIQRMEWKIDQNLVGKPWVGHTFLSRTGTITWKVWESMWSSSVSVMLEHRLCEVSMDEAKTVLIPQIQRLVERTAHIYPGFSLQKIDVASFGSENDRANDALYTSFSFANESPAAYHFLGFLLKELG